MNDISRIVNWMLFSQKNQFCNFSRRNKIVKLCSPKHIHICLSHMIPIRFIWRNMNALSVSLVIAVAASHRSNNKMYNSYERNYYDRCPIPSYSHSHCAFIAMVLNCIWFVLLFLIFLIFDAVPFFKTQK